MASLQEILSLWEEDSKIDETNLGNAAARNPQLHSKYLTMLSTTKLQLRKAESDYLTSRKIKYRYFKGELNRDELNSLGWTQYQGKSLTKGDMDEYLSTDGDLVKLTDKIQYFTVVKEALESIIKELGARTWNVKTALEYQKLISGVN